MSCWGLISPLVSCLFSRSVGGLVMETTWKNTFGKTERNCSRIFTAKSQTKKRIKNESGFPIDARATNLETTSCCHNKVGLLRVDLEALRGEEEGRGGTVGKAQRIVASISEHDEHVRTARCEAGYPLPHRRCARAMAPRGASSRSTMSYSADYLPPPQTVRSHALAPPRLAVLTFHPLLAP